MTKSEREENAREKRRDRLRKVLAQIVYNDFGYYSERAIAAYSIFFDVSEERAKAELEKLQP